MAALDESSLQAQFDARVAAEERIEPKDWMPDATAATCSGRCRSTRTPK